MMIYTIRKLKKYFLIPLDLIGLDLIRYNFLQNIMPCITIFIFYYNFKDKGIIF